MQLVSAHMKNFRSHADSVLNFPPGVLGIIGQNESGKSSVTEFVEFMLYGGRAIRGTKEGLRWLRAPARHTAGGDLSVELGGIVHDITRTETTAYVKVDGVKVAEGTDAVNKFMEEKIGRTLDEFRSSILTRQKDITKIAAMLPTERQIFVRNVLGVGRLDTALKDLRKKKSELSVEMKGLRQGLGDRNTLEAGVKEAEAAVVTAEEALGKAKLGAEGATQINGIAQAALKLSQGQKDQHVLLVGERVAAQAKVDAAESKLFDLKSSLSEAEAAANRVSFAKPELELLPGLQDEKIKLLEAKAAVDVLETALTRQGQLVEELSANRARLRELETQAGLYTGGLEEAEATSGAAENAHASLREQRLAILTKQRTEAGMAATKSHNLRNQLEKIVALGSDAECPTCTQRLGAAFDDLVENITFQIDTSAATAETIREVAIPPLEDPSDKEHAAQSTWIAAGKEVVRLANLKADSDSATQQATDLTARIARAEKDYAEVTAKLATLPQATYDLPRLTTVQEEIRRLTTLEASLIADRGKAAQVADLMLSVDGHADTVQVATTALAEAEQLVTDCGFDAEAHAKSDADATYARTAMHNASVAQARAEEAVTGAEGRVTRSEAAVVDYDDRAEHLYAVEEDHQLHEKADARLADFRIAVAATIRPELEELMGAFVHLLTDGRHEAVTLSEDFEATLHESGVPVEVVSGGTEDIAALAMRLAISQMIAERAGHPLSLLILDEPYGSLDSTRRGNVMTLIRSLKGIFKQVIVISHVDETKEAVDHVIALEFSESEGRTRIVA